MGSTKTENESNSLSGSVISVVWLIHIYLYSITLIIVSQKLFERKLVAHLLLDNLSKGFFSKGFDAEHWWKIYLVAFLTRSVLAACLHARNEMGSFFYPLIANMLFVSIKLFLAGKGFCEIFLPF